MNRQDLIKSTMDAIVASGKNQTEGHKLRHESINSLRNNGIKIDTFDFLSK